MTTIGIIIMAIGFIVFIGAASYSIFPGIIIAVVGGILTLLGKSAKR